MTNQTPEQVTQNLIPAAAMTGLERAALSAGLTVDTCGETDRVAGHTVAELDALAGPSGPLNMQYPTDATLACALACGADLAAGRAAPGAFQAVPLTGDALLALDAPHAALGVLELLLPWADRLRRAGVRVYAAPRTEWRGALTRPVTLLFPDGQVIGASLTDDTTCEDSFTQLFLHGGVSATWYSGMTYEYCVIAGLSDEEAAAEGLLNLRDSIRQVMTAPHLSARPGGPLDALLGELAVDSSAGTFHSGGRTWTRAPHAPEGLLARSGDETFEFRHHGLTDPAWKAAFAARDASALDAFIADLGAAYAAHRARRCANT